MGGDKAKARQIMKRKGVPVVSGSDGPVPNEEIASKIAKKIGLPIVLKASAGGGGHGMKIVKEEKDLEQAFYLAQREALTAFGNSEIYIEEYIPELRHVEVQILADNKGNTVYLGDRDCTIQRRHQKLLEESPSPISTSEKFKKRIGDLGVKAARAIKYRNAGTVEFIVDPKGNIYFIEMNTRIQVEHPVTEAVTGIDIIKEQIKIAAGLPLEYRQNQIRPSGHAIECRINAEDPDRFIPSPGTISFLSMPGGPGVRVDTAIYNGYTIPSHFDSLIAKLIVHGKDRSDAIMKMRSALEEFIIEGVNTTIPFHKKVLTNPDFINGNFYTNFIEKMNSPRETA
jgi:acetyl-CoA carboxylase biotin carboxylase subunit